MCESKPMETAMTVESQTRCNTTDLLDEERNSWSTITQKGNKLEYRDDEVNFEHSNTFSALVEDETYPHIKAAVLTLRKNRRHFPKIRRST